MKIDVEIYHKKNVMNNQIHNGVYVGKILFVTYGYNFLSLRSDKDKYIVQSPFVKFKNQQLFNTEEEAKKYAEALVIYIIRDKLEYKEPF